MQLSLAMHVIVEIKTGTQRLSENFLGPLLCRCLHGGLYGFNENVREH